MKRVPIFCLALASVCGASGATVAPFASYGDGMLSHITPRGWLERALRTQSAGLTGHPEALSYPYNTCLWAGRIPREGDHGKGWWRYEQAGYYTDGLLRLGYALADPDLIAKGEHVVDWTVTHPSADGPVCQIEKTLCRLLRLLVARVSFAAQSGNMI